MSTTTKVILIALTILSYIPQYHRILSLESSAGISSVYILLCNIAASEQDALLSFHFDTRQRWSTSQRLDVAQMTAASFGTKLLIILVAMYPPRTPNSPSPHHFSTTLPPIYMLAFGYDMFAIWDHRLLYRSAYDKLIDFHKAYLGPLSTILLIPALFLQSAAISGGGARSLESHTLLLQSLLFAVSAKMWTARIEASAPSSGPLGKEEKGEEKETGWRSMPPGPKRWVAWYQSGGWATTHAVVFAACQGVLLLVLLLKG